MPQRHPFDNIAVELADWIDQTATYVAEALKSGGRAPFTVRPKPAAMVAFYDAQFFNPDGTPNDPGRAREMDRLGAAQFAQAMRVVMRARERGLQNVLAELSAADAARAGGEAGGAGEATLANVPPARAAAPGPPTGV